MLTMIKIIGDSTGTGENKFDNCHYLDDYDEDYDVNNNVNHDKNDQGFNGNRRIAKPRSGNMHGLP